MGFEPTNGGFADLSLGPLGYRAKLLIIANSTVRSQDAYLRPDVNSLHNSNAKEPVPARTRSQRASPWHGHLAVGLTAGGAYFLPAEDSTLASRKNRAASSGGVGLI